MTDYMSRNKPLKPPVKEHTRWYGKQRDLAASDMIFKSEYEEDEDGYRITYNKN